MSDQHPACLSDEATVETIYSLLKSGNAVGAVTHLKGLGDDRTVLKTWIGVQCDINNIKGDPDLSEMIARPGIEFALERGLKPQAAMMLHNISAFHMPNFDEGVTPTVIPGIVAAAAKQVELREQLDDKRSLGWAYWDYGMTLLAAGRPAEAVAALENATAVAEGLGDKDAAAWARLFIGKTNVRHVPARREEGLALMKSSAATIREVGQDWEKEEVVKILAGSELMNDDG